MFNFLKKSYLNYKEKKEKKKLVQEGLIEYKSLLLECIKDGKISEEEKSKIEVLRNKYNLSDTDLFEVNKSLMSKVVVSLFSDKRITEWETKAFIHLLEFFNLTEDDINLDRTLFSKYKNLALLDKGELPDLTILISYIGLIPKKGELLHHMIEADFLKRKKVTRRVNYGGLTGSIKIAKGLRYRVGSIDVRPEVSEFMQPEDSGIFYITNQRIGYLGDRKHFSFPLAKIGSIELKSDGLYLFKEGRENPYMLDIKDCELTLATISFMLNDRD